MHRRVLPLALALALAAALGGCAGTPQATEQASAPSSGSPSSSSPSSSSPSSGAAAGVVDTVGGLTASAPKLDSPLLRRYGLSGMSVVEIVDHMDETNAHRGSGLNGSVRGDHLLLRDEKSGRQERIAIPDGLFYLSVAPYTTRTHECFAHSLTGCVGEHARAPMRVKVVQDGGKVLYDGPVTTFENGFVGFWLPRGVRGTMSVAYADTSVSAPFTTDAGSATCNTTMQLT